MFPTDSNLESTFTFETNATPLADELPFHILLLGDWSGNLNRKELASRRPIEIDRDNLDEVISRLSVGLDIDLYQDGHTKFQLEFAEIEDFHPDNLFRRVPIFSQLRDVRRRLLNADSFTQAAREVRQWAQVSHDESEKTLENTDAPSVQTDNLLELILSDSGGTAASIKTQPAGKNELSRFVSKIVAPHLISVNESEQSKLVEAVDETISELMRMILHHPDFQALESAWRGLYFLVRRVETDSNLKIFIYDVSKNELASDLKSNNDLTDSFLYRYLVEEAGETSNTSPFSFVGGNYSFNINVDDIATLMRIGKIANTASAPFISHIQPSNFGFNPSLEKGVSYSIILPDESNEGKLWMALRSAMEARYIGLSPMRFLLRLPYGNDADPLETFSFEEFTDNFDHKYFLWGNPSFISALVLAQSFRLYGWEMGKALKYDVEKLPLFTYHDEGEAQIKPCAEVLLTENQLEKLLNYGLLPLISYRADDRIRLSRLQSISSENLGGRWNT